MLSPAACLGQVPFRISNTGIDLYRLALDPLSSSPPEDDGDSRQDAIQPYYCSASTNLAR